MRARFVIPLAALPVLYALLSLVFGLFSFETEGFLLLSGIAILALGIGFFHRKNVPRKLEHPQLGEMRSRDGKSWRTVRETPFADQPCIVTVSGGEEGPSQEGLGWLRELSERYGEIQRLVEPHLFELYENYRSEEDEASLDTSEQLWATATLEGMSAETPSRSASFTYRFSWQDPEDGHLLTVYLDEWEVVGTSVDG
jgi:hypothetical protein